MEHRSGRSESVSREGGILSLSAVICMSKLLLKVNFYDQLTCSLSM